MICTVSGFNNGTPLAPVPALIKGTNNFKKCWGVVNSPAPP